MIPADPAVSGGFFLASPGCGLVRGKAGRWSALLVAAFGLLPLAVSAQAQSPASASESARRYIEDNDERWKERDHMAYLLSDAANQGLISELLQLPQGRLRVPINDGLPASKLWGSMFWRTAAEQSMFPERVSPGWNLLLAAASGRSDAFSREMLAAVAAHPFDETLALHAVLALALPGPGADFGPALMGLSPRSRDLVVAFACQLLPADRIPLPICQEAWASELRYLTSLPAAADLPATTFQHSREALLNARRLMMERLLQSRATRHLSSLLPGLFLHDGRTGAFPELLLPRAFACILRHAPPDEKRAFFEKWLADFISDPAAPHRIPALTLLLQGHLAASPDFSKPHPVPEDIQRLVTESLAQATAAAADSAAAADALAPARPPGLAALALAAAHFPVWKNAARLLAEEWDSQPSPPDEPSDPLEEKDLDAIVNFMEAVGEEFLLPAADIRFLPESPGRGSLQIRLISPAFPVVSWADDGAPLTNPVLAEIAATTCQGMLTMENGYGDAPQVIRRLNSLPPDGRLALDRLLFTGKIGLKIQLNAFTSGKEETVRVFFNTHPAILQSTDRILPDQPFTGKFHLLTEPVPCGDSEAWQLIAENQDHTAGLPHLVLLDADGKVHSYAPGGVPQQGENPPDRDMPGGRIIRRSQMEVPSVQYQRKNDNDSVATAGPPVFVALAVSCPHSTPNPTRAARLQPLPFPHPVSQAAIQHYHNTADLRELMKHEIPPPMMRHGRLVAEKVWSMEWPWQGPTAGGAPWRAAWFAHHSLMVIDPLKNTPPVRIPLDLYGVQEIKNMLWVAEKLWVIADAKPRPPEEYPSATVVLCLDPAKSPVPEEIHLISGGVQVMSSPHQTKSASLLLTNWNGEFISVVTSSGQWLAPDPALRQQRSLRVEGYLSADSALCRSFPGGSLTVISWQGDVLTLQSRLEPPGENWKREDFPTWKGHAMEAGRPDNWSDFSQPEPTFWQTSIAAENLAPLSPTLVLGSTGNALIRFRKITIPAGKQRLLEE